MVTPPSAAHYYEKALQQLKQKLAVAEREVELWVKLAGELSAENKQLREQVKKLQDTLPSW